MRRGPLVALTLGFLDSVRHISHDLLRVRGRPVHLALRSLPAEQTEPTDA